MLHSGLASLALLVLSAWGPARPCLPPPMPVAADTGHKFSAVLEEAGIAKQDPAWCAAVVDQARTLLRQQVSQHGEAPVSAELINAELAPAWHHLVERTGPL